MKKTILIAILAFSMNAFAQVSKTLNLANAGTLSSLLTFTEKNTVTDLRLTGYIDARDMKCMRDEITKLAILDLSDVTILAYTGTEGTYTVTSYPANTMPSDSFYDYINFRGKTSLTHIVLPNSITSVDNYAFYGCSGLTTINIPSLVTTLGVRALPRTCAVTVSSDNPNLILVDDVIFNKDKSNLILFLESKTGSYAMPTSVITISDGAFSDYTGLTSIILPNGLTSIGISAFRGCTRLTSINLPEGLISIGSAAFSGCTGLTTIIVPSSVINLGNGAFIGCMNLTSISLHEGLISIGISAFLGCTGLTSINVPSSVITLDNGAFSGCINLTSISLHEGLTSIRISAFQDCTRLTSITIPSSVTVLGDGAFYNCMGLNSIYTYAAVPINISASVFYNINKATCTLHVPKGSRYLYSDAYQWNEFANIVEMSEFSLSADVVKIDAATGSKATVDITSDMAWKASSNESWLTVSPSSGSGNRKVTFTATANPSNTIRTAKVTVSATGIEPRTISIVQSYNLQSKITKLYDFDCQYPYSYIYDSQPLYDGTYIYAILVDFTFSYNKSTLISMNPDGSNFKELFTFDFVPKGELTLSKNTIYGKSGEYQKTNFVFKINTDGTNFTKFHLFNTPDVYFNAGALIVSNNIIFGSFSEFSNNVNSNNIFKMNTDGTGYSIIYSSSNPIRNITLAGNKLIGDDYKGIVSVNTNDSGFYEFNIRSDIPVIVDKNTIYGMVNAYEGTEGYFFRVQTDGSSYTKIRTFSVNDSENIRTGGLILAGNTLYGMTFQNNGFFSMNIDGSGLKVIPIEMQISSYSLYSDKLTLIGNELYGFASEGISWIVFKVNTTNEVFSKVLNSGTSNSGMLPMSTLIKDDSYLYGTTMAGGSYEMGTLFRINKDGSGYTKLFEFKGEETGGEPLGQLTLKGNQIYGTTKGGFNQTENGCIFKINLDGTGYVNLHDFDGTNGANPNGSLVLHKGSLYGITSAGGMENHGVIFKINPEGTGFTKISDNTDLDTGEYPYNGITISDDEVIYGVSAVDYGGVFRVNTNGTGLRKIFEMNDVSGNFSYCKPLLIGDELYVTTSEKGANGVGVIFKIKTDGTGLSVLYNFEGIDEDPGGSGFRNNSLVYHNGALYGTATGNGINDNGYLYKINLDGTGFTKLSDFNGEYGSEPYLCDLIIDESNTIYGMTTLGGIYRGGIIYKYSLDDPSASIMETIDKDGHIKVFPNPVKTGFHLDGIKGNATICLTDMNGRLFLTKVIENDEYISIESLPSGFYILRIETRNKISVKKLMKM